MVRYPFPNEVCINWGKVVTLICHIILWDRMECGILAAKNSVKLKHLHAALCDGAR